MRMLVTAVLALAVLALGAADAEAQRRRAGARRAPPPQVQSDPEPPEGRNVIRWNTPHEGGGLGNPRIGGGDGGR